MTAILTFPATVSHAQFPHQVEVPLEGELPKIPGDPNLSPSQQPRSPYPRSNHPDNIFSLKYWLYTKRENDAVKVQYAKDDHMILVWVKERRQWVAVDHVVCLVSDGGADGEWYHGPYALSDYYRIRLLWAFAKTEDPEWGYIAIAYVIERYHDLSALDRLSPDEMRELAEFLTPRVYSND